MDKECRESGISGVSIAIGGTVFLSVENRALGALLFTVGLFAVCTFGFNLFTGKVCYIFERDKDYAVDLTVIWLGKYLSLLFAVMDEERPALFQHADHIIANGFYVMHGLWVKKAKKQSFVTYSQSFHSHAQKQSAKPSADASHLDFLLMWVK